MPPELEPPYQLRMGPLACMLAPLILPNVYMRKIQMPPTVNSLPPIDDKFLDWLQSEDADRIVFKAGRTTHMTISQVYQLLKNTYVNTLLSGFEEAINDGVMQKRKPKGRIKP